jgi:hypothetical protein
MSREYERDTKYHTHGQTAYVNTNFETKTLFAGLFFLEFLVVYFDVAKMKVYRDRDRVRYREIRVFKMLKREPKIWITDSESMPVIHVMGVGLVAHFPLEDVAKINNPWP